MLIIYIAIILLAVFGLYICRRIRRAKTKRGPMTCPMGTDCTSVLQSDFNSFLGVGLEYFGFLYYFLIAVIYIAIIIFYPITSPWVSFVLTGLTAGGFLLSLYLIVIQAFYIKSWCTLCLSSAATSILIFALTLTATLLDNISFIPLLATLKTPLVMLHLLGFALGVGGATIADILFMKFLKDFKISEAENVILKTMSGIIWLGLFIAILSGIGLYLPQAEILNESSKFLVKALIVVVITINGSLLNLIVSPRLVDMSFKSDRKLKNTLNVESAHHLRKLSFALGAVSFTSWYFAFALGSMDSIPLTFRGLLGLYILIVSLAVIGSQIFEYLYTRPRSF